MSLLISYVSCVLILLGIDAVWLSTMMSVVYRPVMGPMLLEQVNLVAALVFYLLYPMGLMVFAIFPALKKNSWKHSLTHGALFGFLAYGTYDLTNQATLKYWSTTLTVVDMLWGATLSGVSSVVVFFISKKMSKAEA